MKLKIKRVLAICRYLGHVSLAKTIAYNAAGTVRAVLEMHPYPSTKRLREKCKHYWVNSRQRRSTSTYQIARTQSTLM